MDNRNGVHSTCTDIRGTERPAFRVVELFCGAGGMGLGLSQAGMNIVGACDAKESALAVYRDNLGHDARAIDLMRPHEAIPWISGLKPAMIAGGPPCQDFSSAGKRTEGERAGLTVAMASIVVSVRPEWVLMENVPRAAKTAAWTSARKILADAGYGISELKLNAALYGTPQRRERLFLIGRLGERDCFLDDAVRMAASPREMTLRDVFGGELGDHIYCKPRNGDRRGVFAVDDPAPTIRDCRRPQPASYVSHPGDSNYGEAMFFRPHAGARGVYHLDEPAPAIVRTSLEKPRQSYLANPHPKDPLPASQARVLTRDDTSRIQGFPASWRWGEARNLRDRDQFIANAVPAPLARSLAEVILARHRGDTAPVPGDGFGKWLLASGRAKTRQMASNVRWRLKKARKLLGERTFANGALELAALGACEAFKALDARMRSSLRSALRLFREWGDQPPKQKRSGRAKSAEPAQASGTVPATPSTRTVIASPPPLADDGRRVLAWVSGGAASAVAAKLALEQFGHEAVVLARCETGNEDEDNLRFERDCEAWLDKPVTLLQSEEYADTWDVWRRRRFMSGIHGAPCTTLLKVAPRLQFQRPTDLHVFGYTADPADVRRFERLKHAYFELDVRAPLVERGIDKEAAKRIVETAGVALPRSYALGFPNANCLGSGCVKATSPGYWGLLRRCFPERFAKIAQASRELGARLVRVGGRRIFLDELPPDELGEPEAPACDFLCAAASG